MVKHYLFMANAPINVRSFVEAISSSGVEHEISFFDDRSGDIVSDENFYTYIDQIMVPLHEDLGSAISVLVSHEDSPFSRKLLKEAVAYYPNRTLFMTDVLMKEMSFGDYSSFTTLRSLFKGIDHELMLTVGEYLRSGLDASKAAERLFVHRNTFNYRLNKFIEVTNLDVRDYHNALLLELYFQLS